MTSTYTLPDKSRLVYQKFSFFSFHIGEDAVRFSMSDQHGREYFAIVPAGAGKVYRKRKRLVLEAVAAAIDRGDEPGEVTIPEQGRLEANA